MEIDEWDIWKRTKRVLFGSHFEGDVRELKEHWYINEPMSEEFFESGKRLELEIESEEVMSLKKSDVEKSKISTTIFLLLIEVN